MAKAPAGLTPVAANKLTVERAHLVAALTSVTKAVETRNTYPILANVHLSMDGGHLVLRGTDLDIEITTRVPATGALTTNTVPAKTLLDIARKMPSGSEITFEQDADTLIIKAGRSRFRLACLGAESFPDLKSGAFTAEFDADLSALFAPVAFAISDEETRYYLNGIFLHNPGSALRAVATDGHRMAIHDAATVGEIPAVIVPKKTVGLVPQGTVHVELSDSKIRITKGDTTILSKLIEGTFPDYNRVTPKNNDKHLTVSRVDMQAALDRVGTIASERGGKAVKVELASDSVTLTVTGQDGESATEDLAAEYSAEPLAIGFNTSYLAEILRTATGEKVKLSFGGEGGPALVQGDNDNWTSVLMPMRVL